MEEYRFELQQSFKYAHDGDSVDAQFITLHPPTSKHMKECADLKQAVFRSLPTDVKDEKEDKEEDKGEEAPGMDKSAILGLLYTSRDVSLASVLVTGRILLSSRNSVAFADGEERMTTPMLDAMAPAEFESLVAEYISRFIIASAMAQLKTN